MLWEEAVETDSSFFSPHTKTKEWHSIGNGEEVLVQVEDKKEEAKSSDVVSTKWAKDEIVIGDLVFYEDKWVRVAGIEGTCLSLKVDKEEVKADVQSCSNTIPIEILICVDQTLSVHWVELKPLDTLESVGKRILKRSSPHLKTASWYFDGKVQTPATTVHALNLKAKDKLICALFSYTIRTFKRFARRSNSNWYVSTAGNDSITFVPSKDVTIFGFGMYYVRDGIKTYTIEYELIIGEQSIQKLKAVVTDKGSEDKVFKVYFSEDKSPISVEAGKKISIRVFYVELESSTRLFYGSSGSTEPVVEGNEDGIFRIENYRDSNNSSGTSSGQIPEIYYAVKP
eukprot:TRINITY_DN7177_c0_g1_i5.p1 TRINITY_DN7177_c0_g1~~TRINITY_DN7177_c0_g1_i5.p1  ORF type:complete len:341 (+),score=63.56 TRINITY_DN7177_c0_g1_i5:103-1125(+)